MQHYARAHAGLIPGRPTRPRTVQPRRRSGAGARACRWKHKPRPLPKTIVPAAPPGGPLAVDWERSPDHNRAHATSLVPAVLNARFATSRLAREMLGWRGRARRWVLWAA